MDDLKQMKTCFKCNVSKSVDEFYAHPQMGDGRLGKCKQCTRTDVSENRAAKRQQYSGYEKARNTTPERRAKKREYHKNHNLRNPEKYAARVAVGNAVRDGRLIRPEFCGCCGKQGRVQAHHENYSKPLDVLWLCFVCHREYAHGQVVVARDYDCDLADIRN